MDNHHKDAHRKGLVRITVEREYRRAVSVSVMAGPILSVCVCVCVYWRVDRAS